MTRPLRATQSLLLGTALACSAVVVGATSQAPAQEEHSTAKESDAQTASPLRPEVTDPTQVVLPVVRFYESLCVPLTSVLTLPTQMSVATEQAVGMDDPAYRDHWTNTYRTLSQQFMDTAGKLRDIDAAAEATEMQYPSLQDVASAADTTARNLEDLQHRVEGDVPHDAVVAAAQDAGSLATERGSAMTSSVQQVVGQAPFPTQATADAVYRLQACNEIFTKEPQLEPGQTVPSAQDFHTRLQQGVSEIEGTRRELEGLEVSEDFDQTREQIATAWQHRAEAGHHAAERMRQWLFPVTVTPEEAAALKGYGGARDDAVATWQSLADEAQTFADRIRGADSVQALNDILNEATDAAWHRDVDEEKMLIRVQREASAGA